MSDRQWEVRYKLNLIDQVEQVEPHDTPGEAMNRYLMVVTFPGLAYAKLVQPDGTVTAYRHPATGPLH